LGIPSPFDSTKLVNTSLCLVKILYRTFFCQSLNREDNRENPNQRKSKKSTIAMIKARDIKFYCIKKLIQQSHILKIWLHKQLQVIFKRVCKANPSSYKYEVYIKLKLEISAVPTNLSFHHPYA